MRPATVSTLAPERRPGRRGHPLRSDWRARQPDVRGLAYFASEARFDDFLVHEAAHVFHNCKRAAVGLPHTRRREWLLQIDFRKRETFAYACEAYSRILELGSRPAERRALLSELERESAPLDRVDSDEYRDILREAVTARNGWKRILAQCAE